MKLKQLESLLLSMEGYWLSQRTTYCLTTNQIVTKDIKTHIEKIKVVEKVSQQHSRNYYYDYELLSKKKIIYKYHITAISNSSIQGFLEKSSENINSLDKYVFVLVNNSLQIYLNKENINYTEYIYFINSKFRISVIMVKINNKYKIINFHSDIKIDKT